MKKNIKIFTSLLFCTFHYNSLALFSNIFHNYSLLIKIRIPFEWWTRDRIRIQRTRTRRPFLSRFFLVDRFCVPARRVSWADVFAGRLGPAASSGSSRGGPSVFAEIGELGAPVEICPYRPSRVAAFKSICEIRHLKNWQNLQFINRTEKRKPEMQSIAQVGWGSIRSDRSRASNLRFWFCFCFWCRSRIRRCRRFRLCLLLNLSALNSAALQVRLLRPALFAFGAALRGRLQRDWQTSVSEPPSHRARPCPLSLQADNQQHPGRVRSAADRPTLPIRLRTAPASVYEFCSHSVMQRPLLHLQDPAAPDPVSRGSCRTGMMRTASAAQRGGLLRGLLFHYQFLDGPVRLHWQPFRQLLLKGLQRTCLNSSEVPVGSSRRLVERAAHLEIVHKLSPKFSVDGNIRISGGSSRWNRSAQWASWAVCAHPLQFEILDIRRLLILFIENHLYNNA